MEHILKLIVFCYWVLPLQLLKLVAFFYVVLPLLLIAFVLPSNIWRLPLLSSIKVFLVNFLASKPYSYLPLPVILQSGEKYPDVSLQELYETHPNGIVNSLKSFNRTVFSEGGMLRLSRGTWYMVIVTKDIKSHIPNSLALERIGVSPSIFKGLSTGSYEDFNEIYFFEYRGRSLGSIKMLTELLIEAPSVSKHN